MRYFKILIFIIILIPCVTTANAGFGDKTEIIKFMSKDLDSWSDVLNGIDNGKNIEIYGKLTFPKNTSNKEKIPCIIWMHGSGGSLSNSAKDRSDPWLRMFHNMNIATFILESFKGRGYTTIIGKQRAVTSAEMIVDVYKALKLMANHPNIDASKIGIIGESKGGMVALNSMWKPIYEAIHIKEKFAFHISLYGMPIDFEDFEFIKSPLLILVGEKDDYTPYKHYEEITNKMKAQGHDVKLIVYPNTYHAFDAKFSPVTYKKAHSYKKCRFIIKRDGTLFETTSGLPELAGMKKCRCKNGVKIGRNLFAKKDSKEQAANFISKVLNL